jgi:hypothetical protein
MDPLSSAPLDRNNISPGRHGELHSGSDMHTNVALRRSVMLTELHDWCMTRISALTLADQMPWLAHSQPNIWNCWKR